MKSKGVFLHVRHSGHALGYVPDVRIHGPVVPVWSPDGPQERDLIVDNYRQAVHRPRSPTAVLDGSGR